MLRDGVGTGSQGKRAPAGDASPTAARHRGAVAAPPTAVLPDCDRDTPQHSNAADRVVPPAAVRPDAAEHALHDSIAADGAVPPAAARPGGDQAPPHSQGAPGGVRVDAADTAPPGGDQTSPHSQVAPVAGTPSAGVGPGGGESSPDSQDAPGGVRVDAIDVAGLCGAGLRARLGEIARAESRLAAMKADTLGEIARRSGDGAAAHAATNLMAVSGRRARGEVRDAVRLGELDATRAGLADGSVPVGHAQLIARAAGDAPVDEAFLVGRARLEGYDEFRRTVARHVADISADDGASVLERQRLARNGSIATRHSDGMTVVHLEVDPLTGARLGTVIAAAERRLFRNEDRTQRRTPPQRTADAITQLMVEPDAKRPSGTSLIVVADYDTLNHQLANGRLADGTPIPIGEIAKIAVDAQLLPAVFETATGDLRMGRTTRTATDLQRAALALRDQGCVGCGIPPERCQHHHIDHWRHDGPTDYANLVTVCVDCHNDKIHRQGFTARWNPDIPGFRLRPPDQPPDPPTSRTSPSPTDQPRGQPTARTPDQPRLQPADQTTGQPRNQPTGGPLHPAKSRPSHPAASQPAGPPGRQSLRATKNQPTGQPTSRAVGHSTDQPTGQRGSRAGSRAGQRAPPTGQPTSRAVGHSTDQPTGQRGSRAGSRAGQRAPPR